MYCMYTGELPFLNIICVGLHGHTERRIDGEREKEEAWRVKRMGERECNTKAALSP